MFGLLCELIHFAIDLPETINFKGNTNTTPRALGQGPKALGQGHRDPGLNLEFVLASLLNLIASGKSISAISSIQM